MLALGLLLVLAGALALGVAVSNDDSVTTSAFGVTLSDLALGDVFLLGAATGAVIMLGLALMAMGSARRRARGRQARRMAKDVQTEKAQLSQENAELRDRLDPPSPTGPSRDDSVPEAHRRRGVFSRS